MPYMTPQTVRYLFQYLIPGTHSMTHSLKFLNGTHLHFFDAFLCKCAFSQASVVEG